MISEMNSRVPIEIVNFDKVPGNRRAYGDLIDEIEKDKPPLVILKFFLDKPGVGDKALAAVLDRYGNVFTEASLLFKPEVKTPSGVLSRLCIGREGNPPEKDDPAIAVPDETLFDHFAGIGLTDYYANNGKYSDYPVYSKADGYIIPSLALLSVSFLVNEKPRLDGDSLYLGEMKLPLRGNCLTIDLSEPKALYKTYSVDDVMNRSPGEMSFANKIIIIFLDNPSVRTIKSKYKMLHNRSEIVADSINTLLKDME